MIFLLLLNYLLISKLLLQCCVTEQSTGSHFSLIGFVWNELDYIRNVGLFSESLDVIFHGWVSCFTLCLCWPNHLRNYVLVSICCLLKSLFTVSACVVIRYVTVFLLSGLFTETVSNQAVRTSVSNFLSHLLFLDLFQNHFTLS